MKVSIITAVFNDRPFIESCVQSVLAQTYENIEYIIIDGGSTDGTLEVMAKYRNGISKLISGSDGGMYDALNTGLKLATGDIVSFLHADDIFAHERVIEEVVLRMSERNSDSCYGDLFYVDREQPDKVIRYWKSCPLKHGLFERGWMPPHPTFFAKRELYEKYGLFNTSFRIAADYELMLRFLEKYKISALYIPEVLIKMRTGGKSNKSLRNLFIKTSEDYRAWDINHLDRKFYTIPFKNLSKIPQFLFSDDRGKVHWNLFSGISQFLRSSGGTSSSGSLQR